LIDYAGEEKMVEKNKNEKFSLYNKRNIKGGGDESS
jgi:hypothetical protein